MSLPPLDQQGHAVTQGGDLVDDLRKEIEQLKAENRRQAEQLGAAAPLDDRPFQPQSPQMVRPSPPKGAPPPQNNGRVAIRNGNGGGGGNNSPSAAGNEHPLKREYREIQESAMRWVTTDQPFTKGRSGKGINMCDDISEDFFRSMMNFATFNLPKELRHALAMARESEDKMRESLDVLAQSQKVVDQTSADTLVDVRNDFELSRDRLRNKQLYFSNEVNQYKEEMSHKIDTELSIVALLIRTLEDSMLQANRVLQQNVHPDSDSTHKTLNDIQQEYNAWRKLIVPDLSKSLGESIQSKAAEYLAHEKGVSVHDIIAALLTTLDAALAKAKGTEERLQKHKADMELMCAAALSEMEADFQLFRTRLQAKEDSTIQELHCYKEDTTAKITSNSLTINNYQAVLADHVTFATRMVEKGNDYQMFRQTKEMKNQMVMMYAELAKMRLQYDGVMFQLASNDFDVPIDYIGTLINASTRQPVDWSPNANKQRTKRMMTAQEILTKEETRQLQEWFNEYDRDGSGSIDTSELIGLWRKLWPWATEAEVQGVAGHLISSVDKDSNGLIDFKEFMKIVGLQTGKAGGGAFSPVR